MDSTNVARSRVLLDLWQLRPNNWFLSVDKVEAVRAVYRQGEHSKLPPIILAFIDNKLAIIDGNTRAFVAYENQVENLSAEVIELPEADLSTQLYLFFYRTGPEQGVSSVADLGTRILVAQEYKEKWLDFCRDRRG
jgi:hypothetical protein